MHRARCHTIGGRNPRGGVWTGPYVKLCGDGLDDLQNWAIDNVGQPISPCGRCRPSTEDPHSRQLRQNATATVTASSNSSTKVIDASPTEGRCAIRVPSTNSPAVEAWADDYIRFERRPAWQEQLRSEIREGCNSLEPTPQQILHATFFGDKLANADVENLVLYNIGTSFRSPGRNGIRFEHGAAVPVGPDGAGYAFGYRYELSARSAPFAHWQLGRTLAAFDWTDFQLTSDSKLAQIWLALARARDRVETVELGSVVNAPSAVRVKVRPPQERQTAWGDLVKPIFDGVISAFQAHTDVSILPTVTERLARVLPAEPAEIERHLLEQRWAALGAVSRLVSPYREGVKWDPADHWCVAGELLASDPDGPRWSIRGEIVEVAR